VTGAKKERNRIRWVSGSASDIREAAQDSAQEASSEFADYCLDCE